MVTGDNMLQYKGIVRRRGPGKIAVDEAGSGPPIVFVHGGFVSGAAAWEAQLPLADRWRLIMPHRLGYGSSPPTPGEDFEVDASLIADLLADGAHLVGHSYGAVASLLAAARRPEAVWSLTTIESGSSRVARGNPIVDEFELRLAQLADAPPDDPAERLRLLLDILKPAPRRSRKPSQEILNFVRRLRRFRWPQEAVIPVDILAAAPFPKLWVSGGHSPAFEAITDALATQIGGRRLVLPGGGHEPQSTGAPFNDALEAFLLESSRSAKIR
jgi:pimeloyl-ACP methyl ester carboxylesterase